eukprot:scaffold34661_cov54-Attheya_sp.AAC.2
MSANLCSRGKVQAVQEMTQAISLSTVQYDIDLERESVGGDRCRVEPLGYPKERQSYRRISQMAHNGELICSHDFLPYMMYI